MPNSLNIIDFPANSTPSAPGDIEYFRRPGTDYTATVHPVTPVNPVTSPSVPDPIHLPDGTELRLTLSKKLWLNRLFGDDADHWDGPAGLLEHVSVLFLAACPPEVFRRLARCPETGQMLPLIRRPYDFQTALDAFADTCLEGYTIDEIESLSREFWEQQHCTRVIAKKKIPLHSPAPPPPPMTTMTPTPSPPTGPSNSSTSPPAATPSAAATCSTTCPSPSFTPKSTPPSTPPTSPPSAPPPPSPATPASPPPSPQPRPSEDEFTDADAAADYEELRRITDAWPSPSIGETRRATLTNGTFYTLTGRRINAITDSGPEIYLTWDLGGLWFGRWPITEPG